MILSWDGRHLKIVKEDLKVNIIIGLCKALILGQIKISIKIKIIKLKMQKY